MNAAEYITRLQIPYETASMLQTISLPEDHLELRGLFFNHPEEFRTTVSSSFTGLQILRLYMDWLDDTKAMYAARSIPESIFWDSLQDIPIWCNDYLVKFGKPGFIEWDWVGKTLRLEVIRLGRLQFEPDVLKKELILSGQRFPAGTPILHVHIPAGTPLDLQSVLDSLSRAPDFFRTHWNKDFLLYHCHSWLLSPDLKQLLPGSSRIMQFQSLFQIYGTDDERQAEERVFGFLSDDPSVYPEGTSLQRAVKQHLLRGNAVQMGVGIRPIQ